MISRRQFLASASAAVGAAALPLPAIAQSARASTFRFVPETNLPVLDPIASNGMSVQVHGWHVYDTLFGMNNKFEPRPQMVEGHSVSDDQRNWEFKLRDGLQFHNGEPVRAIDCSTSMARWAARDSYGQQLSKAVDEWQAVDDRTLRVKLKTPFPRLLDAIAIPSSLPPFIMPEHIARTDPNTAITDATGSGPYRFIASEYATGNQVVYEKFAGYNPRSEAAEYTSGGKVAHFDRIEWKIIPDVATATAALANGEVDMVEYVDNDMLPLLLDNPQVKLVVKDPAGKTPMLRLNTLQPPFNNPAIRRILLEAVNQNDFLQALAGSNPDLIRECYAMYPCSFPMVNELGKGFMTKGEPDWEGLKKKLVAAGYNGEKVAIMSAGDIKAISTLAEIAAGTLRRLGMNVEVQTSDWATIAGRRFSKEPVEKGGWSMLCVNWPSASLANPAISQLTRGLGPKGPYFGWFESEAIEKANADYINAATPQELQKAIDEVQRIAFETVPFIPLGQYMQYTAYSSNVDGFLPALWFFPWNLRRV
ncbi:ABC transporter substrate-binding protein [Ensifer sp. ENS05]|uniref:ABC transporter substrate-binding protein n=1 Tax=Ensifer sp. ENS05 TaxID=2769277 RepID=UPI001786D70F|nr:ABC transporter substrate-binding protein [Ensifer sp. ENS05]MBD9596922.1 ABC transporter substrate-binding protein [Ensifer sp. ENS05]